MIVKKGKILDVFNGGLLLYDKLKYYIETDRIYPVGSYSLPLIMRLFSRLRLFARLFRIEPRVSIRLDENRFLIAEKTGIKILDIMQRCCIDVISYRKGFSAPINFCKKGNNIYWGDYGNNSKREEVNIYRLDEEMKVTIVYSFPSQSIRHIHNIIYDDSINMFWILTGDNEAVAGIYKSNIKWDKIEPFKNGERKYRAVVAFPYKKGLLYATDAVDEANYVYYINENGGESTISPINGTCIYGTETNNHFVFSTCVESPEGRGILSLLNNKLAKGVQNKEVHIIVVDKLNLGLDILYKFEKDSWPIKLFQYGTAIFPSRQSNCDGLWCYLVACKKYDGKSIYISSNEIMENKKLYNEG